jgi:PAS domain S-box-containing protein
MDDIIAADKQIEQILQQITVIPEQIADGIVVIDLAGTVRFFNPAWATMHGYDAAEELIGRHISEFHTEEQMKTLVADFIEETKRRGQLAGPIEHMRSDGTVFCSRTKMTTARDKEGNAIGLVVFATNITQPAHAQRHLSDQTIELTAANEQLRHRINEQARAEETVTDIRAEIEAKEKGYNETIARIETEAEEKSKAFEKQMAQLKTGFTEKERAHAEQIANIITEAEQEASTHKQAETRLKEQIAELTAANEKLQNELTRQKQTENALKEDCEQLEQLTARQITELIAAGEQLKQEIAKREQLEQQLSRQTHELTDANKQIQQTKTKQTQIHRSQSELSSQLKTIEKPLQREIARGRAKEDLAQLQARLNLLLANVGKLNKELKLTCSKTGAENQKV